MAERTTATRAVHPAAAALRPRVGRGALLGRAHGRARAPPLGARGDPAGARPLRRLDRHPLLVPPGDLRLVRHARQRRTGARLPHPPRRRQARRERRRDRDRADGQHAGAQGPDRRHGRSALEEDPARHAVAARQAAGARARVPGRQRGDGRRHPVDGVHPVRRVRVGLPGDGGRPGLHRPGGARQGLPLRRRPARRRAVRAPQRPRPGPAGDLRLHALLQVRRGLPQGRQPDGPDHAPAAHRDRTTTTSSTRTTASATRPPSRRSSRTTACCGRPSCCRAPTAATRGSANSRRRPARSC